MRVRETTSLISKVSTESNPSIASELESNITNTARVGFLVTGKYLINWVEITSEAMGGGSLLAHIESPA